MSSFNLCNFPKAEIIILFYQPGYGGSDAVVDSGLPWSFGKKQQGCIEECLMPADRAE